MPRSKTLSERSSTCQDKRRGKFSARPGNRQREHRTTTLDNLNQYAQNGYYSTEPEHIDRYEPKHRPREASKARNQTVRRVLGHGQHKNKPTRSNQTTRHQPRHHLCIYEAVQKEIGQIRAKREQLEQSRRVPTANFESQLKKHFKSKWIATEPQTADRPKPHA